MLADFNTITRTTYFTYDFTFEDVDYDVNWTLNDYLDFRTWYYKEDEQTLIRFWNEMDDEEYLMDIAENDNAFIDYLYDEHYDDAFRLTDEYAEAKHDDDLYQELKDRSL